MDEDQQETRRSGKQRASDASDEGAKHRLSRAERLSARTLAKVCNYFCFTITELKILSPQEKREKKKNVQMRSSEAEDEG
jgi:hypothetical protein